MQLQIPSPEFLTREGREVLEDDRVIASEGSFLMMSSMTSENLVLWKRQNKYINR